MNHVKTRDEFLNEAKVKTISCSKDIHTSFSSIMKKVGIPPLKTYATAIRGYQAMSENGYSTFSDSNEVYTKVPNKQFDDNEKEIIKLLDETGIIYNINREAFTYYVKIEANTPENIQLSWIPEDIQELMLDQKLANYIFYPKSEGYGEYIDANPDAAKLTNFLRTYGLAKMDKVRGVKNYSWMYVITKKGDDVYTALQHHNKKR